MQNISISYCDLKDIPIEVIIATYNHVSQDPLTNKDLEDSNKINTFIDVLEKNCLQKTEQELEELNKLYHEDFLAILQSYEDGVKNPECSFKLGECREFYSGVFNKLTAVHDTHIKFYMEIKQNALLYLKNNRSICLLRKDKKTIFCHKGVVQRIEGNMEIEAPIPKVIFDSEEDKEKFKDIILFLSEEYNKTNQEEKF